MRSLDHRTIERVARLAVDRDGPYERTGWRLEQLLHNAGWSNPPAYDGSPRVEWLIDAIEERRDDPAAVERLLCRISDPIEYDDGAASADVVRESLNTILEAEHLVVSSVSGRPVLARLDAREALLIYTAPDDLEIRLPRLVEDQAMVDVLLDRISQAKACEGTKAYLMALIAVGSFIEGLLYAVLTERDADLREQGFPNKNRAGRTPSDRAGLAHLIEAAHLKQWIQVDAAKFADPVRDFRNFVHPRNQRQRAFVPDSDTLMLCWATTRAVINDLETALLT
jgi:hypothetical protein